MLQYQSKYRIPHVHVRLSSCPGGGIKNASDHNSCPGCVILEKKQGHSCFQYHNNYNKFTIYYHKSCPVSVFLKNRSKKMAGHEREEYGNL